MRIHRIELTNFRGVRHVEVALPEAGVTIIEGDNEVGKTSLFDALDLLLHKRDSSKDARIKAAQPAGQDVGPEVVAELSCGPYRLTYAKRWIRRPETTLTITAPRREQLTGREAHDRVSAILAETLDLGLWEALRLQQGTDLDQPDFNVRSLGQALDRAAGGDQATDREDDLWERIVAEREQYWTATGRPRADRVALADRLAAADERLAQARAAIAELDRHAEELGRLAVDEGALRIRQVQLDAAVDALDAQSATVEALRAEVRQLDAELAAARAEEARWTDLAARRVELIGRVEAATAAQAAAQADAAAAEPARHAASARHEQAEAERAVADAALQVATAAHDLATADLDHRRREIEVAQLRERHQRVEAEETALAEADAIVDATEVTAELLAQIEAAHLELAKAEEAAGVAAAVLTARALAPVTIEVDGQPRTLAAGEAIEVTLATAVEVTVPDLLAVSIEPDAAARARAERVAAARAELEAHCHQGRVADLAEARQAASARADAERTRRQAAERIRGDLRDLTLEALRTKAERLAARIATYEQERPAEPALPADHDAAQVQEALAATALAGARTTFAQADAELTRAAAELTEARVADAGSERSVELAALAVAQAADALATARQARSDEVVHDGLAAAVAAATAAAAARAACADRLADQQPERLDALVANAHDAATRGLADLRRNLDRQRELQITLDLQTEQGLAAHVDGAATERDQLARELTAVEGRAAAAERLHAAFASRRAQARDRYAAPFRDKIEELGRIVFGSTLEVELSPDLSIERRTVDGTTLEWGQLSTGAREQLGLISRLACAMIASVDDGAPVVFDDALGWTDPGRLAEMAAAISVAGRQCQVIVLTCTPGRYAGVGTATTVRLPEGTPAAATAANPSVA